MDLNVKFMHPTDGRLLTVELDDEITAQEAIAELIAADFIPSTPAGYSLAIKGGALLGPVDSFASRSIEKNSILRVIPNTDAGGAPLSTPQLSQNNHSGVPGLDGSSIPRFSIDEVRQSPAATIMLVNMYDDLLLKHEKMATELDHERSKSRDRFVSSILLLVSQLIIAIGVNLLNSHLVGGVAVIFAGGLQASLALYFTFRTSKG